METLLAQMQIDKDGYQAVAEKFLDGMTGNPARALEWSKTLFEEAGKNQVAFVITEHFSDASLEDVERFVTKELVRRAESPEHSTSAQSNLMFESTTAAYARIFRILREARGEF